MFIVEHPFYYFNHYLLYSLFVFILLQVYENVRWEGARKVTKPALLSVNSPDILMVFADASQVFRFLIPPERLDSMILVGSFQLRTFYDSMIT